MITHLRRTDGDNEKCLHISHLYQYISAYYPHEEMFKRMSEAIEEAIKIAKCECKTQIVDMDGEMCFHVYPSGRIVLMVPWKAYEITKEPI